MTADGRRRNRTVLARQSLLTRASTTIPDVLARVAGIQAQYTPSSYVGLWSRLAGFGRGDLDAALHDRSVVHGTLMRSTIHLVSAADYWPFAIATGPARRDWFLRVNRDLTEVDVRGATEQAHVMLLDGPVTQRHLAEVLGRRMAGALHTFADLVRAPPSATWAHRRADLCALAEDWVGPRPRLDVVDAGAHLVRRYLGGFGPARPADISSWSGIPVAALAPMIEAAGVVVVEPASGRGQADAARYDLAQATAADGDEPAPLRLLPHWDAALLVHCRSAGIIREDDRPRIFTSAKPQSASTFLVDGVVAGTWRLDRGRTEIDPFRPLSAAALAPLEVELANVAALFAGEAGAT